ncbi:MAG TPA: immunoglobulin domain-containing protein [Candidatus Acidoferrales bacterium]|nr:immunoglobulin domain-containing protein [Candidatus Acidoferrales bacterium]
MTKGPQMSEPAPARAANRIRPWIYLFATAFCATGFAIYGCSGSHSSPAAPYITAQPSNQTVVAGQTATFAITATGAAPLSYQWLQNGSNISGATSPSYTTPPTTAADNGSTFQVVVSNKVGDVASHAVTLTVTTVSGSVNVLTYHNDVARTGENAAETILAGQNLSSSTFGKVGFLSVTGKVDAEPLYGSGLTIGGAVHNAVFIATEHDLVYAFDADTFAQLWATPQLLSPGETTSDDHSCTQITPEIGVTSTPVIDLSAGPHGTIFVVAMSKDSGGSYHQRLHALDLTTGAEQSGSPVEISATYPKPGGSVTFDPSLYAERASLLLLNGTIYMGWTSHCDQGNYTGWVMGYSEATLQQTSVINLTPDGSEGSVWMAGAGLAADASGNIYLLDANGTFDTTLNASGFPVNGDYGNSFVKLSTTGGHLAVADYFAMHDTVAESNADQDLGSGGVLVLPDLQDSSGTTHHLAVGAGKDARIYVINCDAMGEFNPSNDNAIYQEVTSNGLSGGVFSMAAYFNSAVYYAAVGDSLKAFSMANAKLVTPPGSASAASFPYPGATPSISSNGSSNGIVWVVQNEGSSLGGGPGVLHAYDATNLSTELYNSNQASGGRDNFTDNKFITPMIANGKVYVGTTTGVAVFGLLP